MSSNYPPGVTDSSFGAPWNNVDVDVEEEVILTINGTFTTNGPIPQQWETEIKEEHLNQLYKDIVRVLEREFNDFNFEIT